MPAVGSAGQIYLSVGDGTAQGDVVSLYAGDNPNCYLTKGGFHAPPPQPGDPTRTVTLTLNITGRDANDMWDNYRRLETKLRQARAAQGPYGLGAGVTLGVRFDALNTMVYFDVLDGLITAPDTLIDLFPVAFMENISLQLICLPYARGLSLTDTVSGTITNGTAATLYRAQVPGDVPALLKLTLTDVSTNSKVINRWRIGQLALPHMASTDFAPIVDMTAVSPGTATTDSSSYCGSNFARVIASSSWQTIANASKPSAPYTSGLFDVWTRVRDSTALLSPPSNFTATAGNGPSVRQSVNNDGTSSTASATWPSTTLAGSTLIAAVTCDSSATPGTISGYTTGEAPVVGPLHTTYYTVQSASAQSGTVSCSLSGSANWVMALIEIQNVAAASLDVHTSTTGSVSTSASTGTTGTTTQNYEFVVAVFGYSTSATYGAFSSGYTSLISASHSTTVHLAVATHTATASGTQTCSQTVTGGTPTYAAAIVAFKAAVTDASTLAAATHRFLLAARDAGSGASSLTGTEVDLTITAGQYIVQTWTAATGANDYYLYWWNGTAWAYFDVGNVTSYLFVSTSGATPSSLPTALPVTAEFRAQLGLKSGTILLNQPAYATQQANSLWEMLYLGTLSLPPQVAQDGGALPDWLLQIQGTHPTLTPNLDVDATWLVPHFWSQLTATYNDGSGTTMNLATKRAWVIDTRRDGRTSTRLLSTVDSSEAGQAITSGHLYLGPGDTTLVFLPDITGGVSDVTDCKFTAQLTITPRYALVSGVPF